jgi:hypothetical protein
VPPLPPEVIRAKFLIIQAHLLIEIALVRCSKIETEIIRSNNLVAISRELLDPQVQELVLDMPIDGSWMPAAGPYTEIIDTMLDEGSLVLEEDHMPEDDDGPWRVRLTDEAVRLLA